MLTKREPQRKQRKKTIGLISKKKATLKTKDCDRPTRTPIVSWDSDAF